MQATPLAEKQQQFGTWSYKTDEKNVLKKQVLLENTWVGDKCNGYEKKLKKKKHLRKQSGVHPALKREDRLGKDPFAGFGTVVEDITESGYTKNQPILLGFFWENAFFVFLHYKINGSKGVFWP